MPSTEWFAAFWKEKALGSSKEEAIQKANDILPSGKDFARYTISDSHGEPVTLSLAVEGGGRQLRYIDKITNLSLSEHGDWRHNHLRALETYLGKKPYFPYLFPAISKVYQDKEIRSLEEFNNSLFDILYSFINLSQYPSNPFCIKEYPALLDHGLELAEKLIPGLSSIESISMLGKESLLGFLAYRL